MKRMVVAFSVVLCLVVLHGSARAQAAPMAWQWASGPGFSFVVPGEWHIDGVRQQPSGSLSVATSSPTYDASVVGGIAVYAFAQSAQDQVATDMSFAFRARPGRNETHFMLYNVPNSVIVPGADSALYAAGTYLDGDGNLQARIVVTTVLGSCHVAWQIDTTALYLTLNTGPLQTILHSLSVTASMTDC